jgi:hypothetical protein
MVKSMVHSIVGSCTVDSTATALPSMALTISSRNDGLQFVAIVASMVPGCCLSGVGCHRTAPSSFGGRGSNADLSFIDDTSSVASPGDQLDLKSATFHDTALVQAFRPSCLPH